MKASKEAADYALKALMRIKEALPGSVRPLFLRDVDEIGRFLKAAHAKLPKASSYDKERIRRMA